MPLDLRAYRRGAVVISDVPPKIFIQKNIIAKTLGFSSRRPRAEPARLGVDDDAEVDSEGRGPLTDAGRSRPPKPWPAMKRARAAPPRLTRGP